MKHLSQKIPVLPVSAYTSQEWFEREQREIFSKSWRFAGFVEDITEPGQYISVQAGLNKLFVIMGMDGELRAFHNLCRHRGAQLLRSIGNTKKVITCPYHDWAYDLEGNLLTVPEAKQEFQGLEKSCLGLKRASVGVWRSMLFVHPEFEAEPLEEWFAPVEPFLGPHDVEALVEDPKSATSYEIKANWKVIVENYIDVYHLSHLHSNTLSMYNHKQAEFGFYGPHFAFQEPLSANYLEKIETSAPLPLILPKEKLGAWVSMLFPGLGLAESECTWSIFHITPLAPDLTRVETRTRVKNASSWEMLKQMWNSSGFWSRYRGKYKPEQSSEPDDPMTSGDFMAEDIYVCEQLQKAFQSPYFEIGPTAESGERPVREHQEVVLSYLETTQD